ncbi:unnamed protein product [Rangifer tarandus platyrhynchus]|uniref:Uncharacterized protein n=1 Tax=Rangifer tarandus platyrhynchus TaxID=3082113 RepID=A0ABN8YYR6_RANTA|nr:unnamed protein product [Rangifer tarandus platyrhynchus]
MRSADSSPRRGRQLGRERGDLGSGFPPRPRPPSGPAPADCGSVGPGAPGRDHGQTPGGGERDRVSILASHRGPLEVARGGKGKQRDAEKKHNRSKLPSARQRTQAGGEPHSAPTGPAPARPGKPGVASKLSGLSFAKLGLPSRFRVITEAVYVIARDAVRLISRRARPHRSAHGHRLSPALKHRASLATAFRKR